ncbi:hypothetical protein MTR67_013483 [Solanum verrucosum]|uniref:Uncharacterized protein n=1 Tax=Solanum verrucosum TaxID=315347 RepID=A0AAF0QBK6_SOLVR|nr:hypothetical protein MTR67_013483 [Solanum verrucosum]
MEMAPPGKFKNVLVGKNKEKKRGTRATISGFHSLDGWVYCCRSKNQNNATDKVTNVEQYQGDARELINAKFQRKSNKEEQRQLVPDDNSGEGRDYRNNLGVVRDATVDRAVANSFKDATTFNSNNEENLENKGKSIEAARRVVGKDGVLGSPNVVAAKQDNSIAGNSNNEWTLVSHKKKGVSKSSNNQILHQNNSTEVELDESNIVIECTQFDLLRDENVGSKKGYMFDKDVNNLGLVSRDLNKNRDHVDQQVVLTHENEFIVTEGISDLVEEEENITSPPISKSSPQTPEFVPTSKTNPSMAMTVDSFKKSLAMNTKDIGVLAKRHDQEVIVSGISPTAASD